MAFQFTIPNASIKDTLRYIINFVNHYSTSPFIIQFAKEFHPPDGGNKEQFIRRVFDYICTNGYYKLDEDGEEEVWTPAKTIRTRNAEGKFQYDCKKVTILLGAVLRAAGIEPVLKHIYYSDGAGGFKDYTHIYIIVPYPDMDHYLTIDPTNNCMWNTEVPHDKATLYFLNGTKQEAEPMNLHLIGNNNKNQSTSVLSMFGESAGQVENDMGAIMGCPNIGYYNYEADRIGLKNDYFSYDAKELALHVTNVALPIFLAGRAAFLGLLYLGKLLANTPLKLNIASRLAKAWQIDKARVQKTWWKLGGTASAAALKTAIVKGSGITISGPIGQGYDYPIDLITPWIEEHRSEGIGQVSAAAAIVAAAPVVAAILTMLKGMGVIKEGETDPALPPGTLPDVPAPGPPGGGPTAFNMLDLSSPGNTIVKSVFLMGLSGMIAGPSYYILNIACMSAILFSFIKTFTR